MKKNNCLVTIVITIFALIILVIVGMIAGFAIQNSASEKAAAVPQVVMPTYTPYPTYTLVPSQVPTETAIPSPGDWTSWNDEYSVGIQVSANSGPAILVIRCKDQRIDIFVNVDTVLYDGSSRVVYRFDKEDPQIEYWGIGVSNGALFAPDALYNPSAGATDFRDELFKHTSFAFQYRSYVDNYKAVVFNLTGVKAAYDAAVGDHCN